MTQGAVLKVLLFLITRVKICLNGRLHSGVNSVFGFSCIHLFFVCLLVMGILIYPPFFLFLFFLTILSFRAPPGFILPSYDPTFLRLWLTSLSDL